MTARTLSLLGATLWALIAHPHAAGACSPPEQSVAEIIEDADLVVRGRIIQTTLVTDHDYDVVRMTVEAYAYWKDPGGTFASIVEIYTPTPAGCGLDPHVGDVMTFTCWSNVLGWSTAEFYSWMVHPLYPPGLDDLLGPPLRVPTDSGTVGALKGRYQRSRGNGEAGHGEGPPTQ